VSYAYVEMMVRGVLGVTPDAPNSAVSTTCRLPENMTWAAAKQIPLGRFVLSVRQETAAAAAATTSAAASIATTTVVYSNWTGHGRAPTLHWRAGIAGRHSHLEVGGKAKAAEVSLQEGDERLPVSWVDVALEEGEAVQVSSQAAPRALHTRR
jgi:hypothetical protein